jgi:predicted membrane-bound mannosyltransferase
MYNTLVPQRPDSPAPEKKSHKVRNVVLGGVAVLFIGSAFATQDPAAGPTTGPGTTVAPTFQAPASIGETTDTNLANVRTAWATGISEQERAAMCAFYNTPPVGVTQEMVELFSDSAGISYSEGERLLSVVLSEEC